MTLSPTELIARLLRGIVAGLAYLQLVWGLRRAPSRSHGGLKIYDISLDEMSGEAALAKVIQSLQLLEEHAPSRYRRLKKDVRRVIVAHYPYGHAAHFPRIRAIMLNYPMVVKQPPATAAALIVHEGVHARLWHGGIRSRASIGRIERLCNQAMLDFATSLPRALYLVRWVEQVLASSSTAEADDEQLQKRRARDAEAMLADRLPSRVARYITNRWH